VINGEIVAFDQQGRPSFNALQNYGSSPRPVVFYVFDVLVLRGKDVMSEPLERRQSLLTEQVLPQLKEPVRYAGVLDAALSDLIASVKAQGLEGLVAKRLGSRYKPGMRSGAWIKMRVNRGQEFVIGGYTLGTKTFRHGPARSHRCGRRLARCPCLSTARPRPHLSHCGPQLRLPRAAGPELGAVDGRRVLHVPRLRRLRRGAVTLVPSARCRVAVPTFVVCVWYERKGDRQRCGALSIAFAQPAAHERMVC
jgi:hypothetical protein